MLLVMSKNIFSAFFRVVCKPLAGNTICIEGRAGRADEYFADKVARRGACLPFMSWVNICSMLAESSADVSKYLNCWDFA